VFLSAKPIAMHRQLHNEIDPSSSTWTFEGGEVAIVLDKRQPGQWPRLFKDGEEPAETFSEAKISEMASVLRHMTSDKEPANFQTATLLGEGTDAEIDSSSASDMTYFSEIDGSGTAVESYGPHEILSRAMASTDGDASLIVKRDVDGMYLDADWEHSSLYPVRYKPSLQPLLTSAPGLELHPSLEALLEAPAHPAPEGPVLSRDREPGQHLDLRAPAIRIQSHVGEADAGPTER
jgi:hypothetical protein